MRYSSETPTLDCLIVYICQRLSGIHVYEVMGDSDEEVSRKQIRFYMTNEAHQLKSKLRAR